MCIYMCFCMFKLGNHMKELSNERVHLYAAEMVSALGYLHDREIVYR